MTDRRHTNQRTGEIIDDPHIRPFGEFLREQSAGRTHEELSEGGPGQRGPAMTVDLDWLEPSTDVPRDRWNRPLIVPPAGGKPVGYTRASTFAGTLDDTYNLEMWKQRQVARGLAVRPDLQLRVASLGPEPDKYTHTAEQKRWKASMDEVCDAAREAAGSSAKANLGTALHAYTDRIDKGLDLGIVPDAYQPHLKAYEAATSMLTAVHIERFVVCDDLQVAGTTDRILAVDGHDKLIIGDTKGLALTTRIPTPAGWSTMGELGEGDQVFGSDGHPCRVTAKSTIKRIGTYVVRFDDGSEVVCDSEHIWWTAAGLRMGEPTTKTIQEVIDTLHLYGQAHHRVPVAGVLQLPRRELLIDPYLLGCWLGDGASRGGTITKDHDLFAILETDGHALGKVQACDSDKVVTRTVLGLTAKLNSLGLLHNKQIPEEYLRGSADQRLRLLQGLMDTDGTWNTARNRAKFTTTTKALALGVEELLCTLGQRCSLSEQQQKGYGLTVTAYNVEWRPTNMMPFRLPRKVAKASMGQPSVQSTRRVIVSVTPGPDVETACISVDSPNRTYLCGEHMIPTHNSGNIEYGQQKIAVQLACYAHGLLYNHETNTRAPIGDVDLDRALIIALNASLGTCELVWIDIAAGWEAAQQSAWARTWRKRKNLTQKFQATPQAALPINPTPVQEQARDLTVEAQVALEKAIREATTPEQLYQLWTVAGTAWQPHHTELAAARKAELTNTSRPQLTVVS